MLGVNGFGVFSICLAMAGLICAFDAFGTGTVLLKATVIDKTYFHSNAFTIFIFHVFISVILIILYLVICLYFFKTIPFIVLIQFALSEILLYSLILLQNQMYQAHNKYNLISINNVFLALFRLAFILLLDLYSNEAVSIEGVSGAYLFATTVWFIFSCLLFYRNCKFSLNINFHKLLPIVFEGIHFCLSKLAAIGNSEVDKAMVGKIQGVSEAGIYAASMRIINMIMVPVNTVFSVTMPQYFKYGEYGIQSNLRFSKKFVPYLLAYTFIIGIAGYSLSKYIPVLLGPSFNEVIIAIKYLSFFPCAKVISTFLADAITGAGYQSSRSKSQLVALFVNIILNFYFIPIYSWSGAIVSLFISEFLLILMYFYLVYKKSGNNNADIS
jgi:O-antigen/teichoic acid export membrane protein